MLSRVQLFATPWTIDRQAPPSMEFSRPEYWSGLPFPSAGHLPNPGIEPRSPTLQADSLLFVPSRKPGHEFGGTLFNPVYAKLLQSHQTLCNPMDCSLPGFVYSWDSPGKKTGVGCHFLPGIELGSVTSPALAGGFFTTSTTWEARSTQCIYSMT